MVYVLCSTAKWRTNSFVRIYIYAKKPTSHFSRFFFSSEMSTCFTHMMSIKSMRLYSKVFEHLVLWLFALFGALYTYKIAYSLISVMWYDAISQFNVFDNFLILYGSKLMVWQWKVFEYMECTWKLCVQSELQMLCLEQTEQMSS